MSSSDSVGSLLAAIANLTTDGMRVLSLSDRRQWGLDEHEQLRALEDVLDGARKDFQELSPLLGGQHHYEHDRTHDSILNLQSLRDRFATHIDYLKDWSSTGGPINPTWIRETKCLQRDLHRSQYRSAARIFTSQQESSTRCLGAFLIFRRQRVWSSPRVEEGSYQHRHLEELQVCNRIGSFHRFGEGDVAFVCDFCDGHLVWKDLEKVPSVRTASWDATWSATKTTTDTGPKWQATGFSCSKHAEKQVVFAPVAIANHVAPQTGDWHAGILCPFCEHVEPRDKDDEEDEWKPEHSFEDIATFQEHLEWQHTAAPTGTLASATKSCSLM